MAKNYKPVLKTIAAANASSGIVLPTKLSTASWGLLLIRGTAVFSTGILSSGAVAVWVSNSPQASTPNNLTFTDANGIYGITTKANVDLNLKFYSK